MNHDLINRLKQSRSRYRSRLQLRGFSMSLVAALATLVVPLMLPHLFQPIRLPTVLLWLLPLATLLSGIIWTLVHAQRRTPALERVAQLADRHFRLNERTSSAIKVQARGARSTVEAALLADAASHAHRIDPEALVRVRMPGFAWLVPVLGAIAFMLILLPQPESTTPAMPATAAPDELSAQEREQTGSNVRHAAEMIASDAEDKGDAYLAAIARSLEELGEQIERGELVRSAIQQELGQILDHVSNALGKDNEIYQALLVPFSSLAAPAELAEQLSNMKLPLGGEQVGSEPDQTGVPLASNDSTGGSSDLDALGALDDLLAGSDEDNSRPQRIASALGVETDGHYMDVDPEMMAQLAERRQQLLEMQAEQGPGAIPIGAAEQSSAGAGDIAGDGTQALGEDLGTDLAGFEFEQEELQLPFDEESTGRRIRVEAAADTRFTDVSSTGAGPAGNWLRQNETPLTQDQIGLAQRETVSRYFLPVEDSR